jgi:hydrogenase maturation protease
MKNGEWIRTVILGLGNPVCGDDAAGLRVAEIVEDLLRERPIKGATVATSHRAGLEIIELLAGAERAVIVDCLAALDPVPGRVRRLTLQDCAGSARLVGVHDLSVADAFALARATGVPMPSDVAIYGIEAEHAERIEDRLSPSVAEAVGTLAREIYEQLRRPSADHGHPGGQLAAERP